MALEIRPATIRDIARITTICVEGLPDDPTFDYLWRYRHQYPDDNYFFWLQRLKEDLFDIKKIILVAVEPAQISEKGTGLAETIVAFAIWERYGNSETARRRRQHKLTWTQSLHRKTTAVENWLISKQFQRRDGDPARIAQFISVMDDVQKQYWENMYPDNFHLELLCTHPDYRRRGAGTMLTSWGLKAADLEGADAGVESSPMGFPLYKSLGFTLLEERIVKVDGDDADMVVRVMHRNATASGQILDSQVWFPLSFFSRYCASVNSILVAIFIFILLVTSYLFSSVLREF